MRHLLLPTLLCAGCAGYDKAGAYDSGYGRGGYGGTATGTGGYIGPGGTGTGTGGGEVEDPTPALPPAMSDRHVFIVNTERDTLTRVDAITREVRTIEVGDHPTRVLVTPDHTTATVFNRRADTVSLVDVNALTTRVVGVRDDMNTMVMSPDGGWLALYYDALADDPLDPSGEGVQSFNEVSFVDVAGGQHYPMAAGFNPHTVQFTEDGRTAVVVSDNTLAIIDLTVRPLLPEILTISDALEPPRAEELVLARDGSYGFLRQFGASELLVVDLVGRGIDAVPVGENPTDLDVTPDGTRVVAVSRAAAQLWIYELARPYEPAKVLDIPNGTPFGQAVFDPRGGQALLYTNATPLSQIGIWSLDTDTIVLRDAIKAVTSISITPSGETAVLLHDEGPAWDPDSPFQNRWALTLLDLTDGRANPLLLPAEPLGLTHSTSGRTGYFVFAGQPLLDVVDYQTLLFKELPLPSDPEFVGVLPDDAPGDGDEPAAWVSQTHELGRITFYDWDDDALETVTGFELNGQVEEPDP